MYRRMSRFSAAVVLAWGLAVACWAEAAWGGEKPQALPAFSEVEKNVLRHFALLPDYRPGDIIARSEVQPLFAKLEHVGWKVADREDILRRVPADNDYLVQKLRTSRGREFMRRIASFPGAYDRLDRLSWLPHGRQTVHDLIHKKGGEEMIKYLTTASGGSEMGKMMSNAPKGADFNKPTGRVYTPKLLLARLKTSYAAAQEATNREDLGKR